MALPVSLRLRRIFAAAAVASFCVVTRATTFPLPIPTRPATVPARPTDIGEVILWGTNTTGSVAVPPSLSNIVAIAAGTYHALALDSNGVVTAWGPGTVVYGETNIPPGLSNVVKIAAARFHDVALKSDGTVVAWGSNNYGESSPPPGLSGVIDVAAGVYYSMALKLDGSVVAWGDNRDGSLTMPSDATNIVAIAAGYGPLLLKADGTVVYWPQASISLPALLTDVAAVGGEHSRAIRTDGAVIVSGTIFDVPVGLRATKIYSSAGAIYGSFTAAIKGDRTVAVWGDNVFAVSNVPPRLRDVIELAAGGDFIVALQRPTPPIPTTARVSAEVVNGFVVGMNIIDGGEGYAVAPQVTITDGGGSGATATAQISKGVVTGFTITNAGIGYTSAPTVTIEAPPFLPRLTIATSRVGVTMQVVPGKRYQLESSNDLPNFGPVGTPFVADTDTISQEFTVSETGQFFRIVEVP